MKLCLGTVQFGLDYGIQGNGQPQKEKVFKMLDFAAENGIDILDTASAYGEAEKILGEYIRLNPEKTKNMEIISKLKPDAFMTIDKGGWEKAAVQNAKDSLERLGISKFAAYLFHNAAHIFDEDAVAALEGVKNAGLTDWIGVSIYTPEEAMKALEYPSMKVLQIPYNIFDQRLDHVGFFTKAKEKGVLIFARSSLLQGLVMMNPDKLPDRIMFARNYLTQYLDICNDYNMPPLKAAVGYVGVKDEIDYVVFGIDNINQLEEYISIRDSKIRIEMIDKIKETFSNVEERLVNPVLWE